jgi:hypothetical protein
MFAKALAVSSQCPKAKSIVAMCLQKQMEYFLNAKSILKRLSPPTYLLKSK